MRIRLTSSCGLAVVLAIVALLVVVPASPHTGSTTHAAAQIESPTGMHTHPPDTSRHGLEAGVTLQEPFTIEHRFQMTETGDKPVLWLMGLGTEQDQVPKALAIEWALDTRGWFPVWALQLSSQLDLLPEGLIDGRTEEGSYIHLLREAPQAGHDYRLALSFDPETHGLSFVLEDLSTALTLSAGSLPLQPFEGLLHPGAAHIAQSSTTAEPVLSLEAVTVSPWSTWYGLPLTLQSDFSSQLLTLSPDDGRPVRKVGIEYLEGEPVLLRIAWPREPFSGAVHIKAVQGKDEQLLLTSSWQPEVQDIRVPQGSFPMGDFALVLEYVDGPRRAVIHRHDLRIITAKVSMSYIIHGRDYDRGTLVGQLTITPQIGNVEGVEVRIAGSYRSSGPERADTQPRAFEVLRERLDALREPMSFSFEIPAPPWAGQLELTASFDNENVIISGGDRRISGSGVAAMPDDALLFPFVVSPWRESPDNITNLSHHLERPAGRDGFITVQGGGFFTGDGRPIRFLGVNCSFSGCFPDHASAEKIARQLARFGVNLVRFHHMDNQAAPSGIWRVGVFPREFDPDQLDRLDYFIYQLKENGIYSNLNLHVSRTMQPQEGFPDPGQRPTYDKGLNMYHPDIIAHQKEYARELLTHLNPYTGNRYVEEPAIAMIEITNEGGLINFTQRGAIDAMPAMYKEHLDAQWQRWLEERYQTTERLAAAWGVGDRGLPTGEGLGTGVGRPTWESLAGRDEQVRLDYVEFLWDVEQAYFHEMYAFIREELRARAPISGTQVRWSPQGIQAQLDYIDVHSYWRHPEFPGASWDNWNWFVRNESMAATTNAGNIPYLASTRVADKPFVISEHNHPAPNTYGSEGFLLAGAYGAFQDWDGIVIFAWTRDSDFWTQKITSFFDIKSHPTKLVTLPAVWALFLRGDVQSANTFIFATLGNHVQQRLLTEKPVAQVAAGDAGLSSRVALQHGVALVVGDDIEPNTTGLNAAVAVPQGPVVTSDTGELHWDLSGPDRGVVWLDTERSKAVIGYGAGRTFELSGVTVSPGPTLQDGWSAITMTVMEGDSFSQPGRILLTATGYAANPNMGWEDLGSGLVTVRTRWGDEPSIVEGIPARVELPVPPDKVLVYALDGTGERRAPVSIGSEQPTAGRTVFDIGPEHRTLWYEIVILP